MVAIELSNIHALVSRFNTIKDLLVSCAEMIITCKFFRLTIGIGSIKMPRRGVKAKALTRGEAAVLGIPFPLQRGWARKHSGMKIDGELLPRLTAYADAARQAAEEKVCARVAGPRTIAPVCAQLQLVVAPARIPASPVPGFVLRRARRFRKVAPWA